MIPYDTIDNLTATWADLDALCTGLTPAQWATPTECPGWDVQDQLSHVVSTERVLQGLPATAHQAGERDYVHNPIGTFNENEIDSRRALPGDAVLAEWRELRAMRERTLRAGTDEFYDQAMQTPVGPGTMASFLSIRVLDCWSHEQDIRRALGRPGGMDTRSASHTVDRLIASLPMVVGKRAACPDGEAVAFHITGPVRRDVVVQVRDGRAAIVADAGHPPAASLTMDTETFVVLTLGRRAADQADVTYVGDEVLARTVAAKLGTMI